MVAIRFDHGPDGRPALFEPPRRLIRADALSEVVPALEAAADARAAGRWVAGYVAYEAGYAFSHKLRPLCPAERPVPLVLLGVFDGWREAMPGAAGPASITAPRPRWDRARYGAAFDRARALIAAGDIYQVNLTFPLDARAGGGAAALYAALAARQPVAHGAFVDLGGPAVLCRSPELFFEVTEGCIRARPMKGTRPRDPDPVRDAALARDLAASEKDRAENLMIVDLLRNDIGRVARIGSVRVPRLFTVESYATVHQMVSEIVGQLRPGVGLPELFAALFPCGSVTGAPKIRAMQVIAELETRARGVYCGAVGWAAPDGDMRWGVAIRTALLTDGAVRLDVGGGVVHDSTADGEWEEALWKTRFATLPPD